MTDALALAQARFEANGLTFAASRDDTGRYLGQCPRHRTKKITLDLEPVDNVMLVHTGPCGCLPYETIRQLGLSQAVPHVPAGMRQDVTKRRLGVRAAVTAATEGDPYERFVAALDAGGLAGSRSDPGGVRGEGRYTCPACGALGDGHGLRVRRFEGRAAFDCYGCGAGGEILDVLGLTWADIGWTPPADDLSWIPDDTNRAGVHVAVSLDEAEAVFTRWFGKEYDLGALDVVLAVAAVEQLGGDPPWLMVVSGSGNAKTETVVSLAGAGAHIVSTISSEGALLSATPGKERAKDATGGLLRKVGARGLVVIKDFTSILSMNRDMRSAVLAALREVYDGRWDRIVGTEGGRTLTWTGRLVVIGAVTTAYDSAHTVIAAMGDRFCLVRVDSTTGRRSAGRQALSNVDHEVEMRSELGTTVGGLLTGVDRGRAVLEDEDQEVLLDLADLVTLGRTAVERDYKGDVIDAHAPEMPTRFAKMLGQVTRGGLAVGMSRTRALAAAVRVAGDSMPPLRLAILADVAANPYSRTGDVRGRLQRPRSTVDRELQALHILGLLVVDNSLPDGWRYRLSEHVHQPALDALVTRNVSKGETSSAPLLTPEHTCTDISGDRGAV